MFRVSSVWAPGLDADLAPSTERTMCGFVGLTLLFRGLVRIWWHLDLLKCVLNLTMDILMNCSLPFMVVLRVAQSSLSMFCEFDGKSDPRIVFARLASIIDVYVQHVDSPCHTQCPVLGLSP